MKIWVCLFATICSSLYAVEPSIQSTNVAKGPKSVAELVNRSTGGKLITTYKTTNKIYFVNAQKRVRPELVDAARAAMQRVLRTPIETTSGKFTFPTPEIKGELSLYIIDDNQMPMSLISPEGRWAFVNVAKLGEGRGEKPQYFEARFRKECARVSCMLFGGIGSAYPSNLLGFISSASDLDKFESDVLPVDGPSRCHRYLLDLGVKPFRSVTYKKACEEGWAPVPTNDVQKAIWEEVHKLPTEPIRINPEAKKVER